MVARRPRVLHLLSQRPSLTGSGVTLDALVRHAARAGWEQRAVVGVPAEDRSPEVAELGPEQIHPLVFDRDPVAFPLPGMSDVMPYATSRFSALSAEQVLAYQAAWRGHLAQVIADFAPDVIHCHHVWLLSALVKDVAPDIPLVIHCHATGLRQMALCPHLAPTVQRGCARAERFVVLHGAHAAQLARELGVDAERVHVVGAGFRGDLFHGQGLADDRAGRVIFVGKYSAAKGLPWLLDAVEALAPDHPQLRLHVAGSGAGAEADALAARMGTASPRVVLHGMLRQPDLAALMRRCAVCVLPSLYEGVPLVLAEALACGCRLVATELPGVVEHFTCFDELLDLVPLPRLIGPDTPVAEDLPAFVAHLTQALGAALARPPLDPARPEVQERLAPFRWSTVFARVEAAWRQAMADAG